jgi:hypothetical protein
MPLMRSGPFIVRFDFVWALFLETAVTMITNQCTGFLIRIDPPSRPHHSEKTKVIHQVILTLQSGIARLKAPTTLTISELYPCK